MIIGASKECESRRFFTADGKSFVISSKKKFGIRWRKLEEDPGFLDGQLDVKAATVLSKDLATSIKTETDRYLDEMVQSGISAVEPLMKSSLYDLRRGIIESSAKQLRILFSDFIQQNSDQIAEMFKERTQGAIDTMGPIPKLARFKWEMRTAKGVFVLYCLELAPHRRTISLKRIGNEAESYRWAMPWLCLLPVFKNDKFAGLTAFYTMKPLEKADDSLLACGLPGKANTAPWHFCDGFSVPNVRLSDPKWVDKLLDWFFGSVFVYHTSSYQYDNEYRKIKKNISQYKSFRSWDGFSSRDDALDKVCQLSFPSVNKNLDECARVILENCSGQEATAPWQIVQQEMFESVGLKFEQTIGEKFVFLVKRTSVDPDLRDKIKKLFASQLNKLKDRLEKILFQKISGLGRIVKFLLVKNSDQEQAK